MEKIPGSNHVVGETPVLPANTDRLPRDVVRAKYGYAPNDFVVFYNFDVGSFYRKNPMAAIRAFAEAFPKEPRAYLLFKIKGACLDDSRCQEMLFLAKEKGVSGRFRMITEYLPRRELDGLTDACDVYLSLHKSEGFGIGMAESMSLGHPVVATDWSANTEYCLTDNSMPISYRLVPIQPWEYPPCMKEWAEADEHEAARALKRLFEDECLRTVLGRRAREFIGEHYSVERFKEDVLAFLHDQKKEDGL